MTESRHSIRFPGESDSYRSARDDLLDAEIELRRESVAAKRRTLPLGGRVPEDYVFEEAAGNGAAQVREVRLSELFAEGRESLIIYSFMFGPEMKEACPLCTSILDGLDGQAPHVLQRVNLAVVAKSPIGRIMDFARSRGWRNLRLLSSARSTYNHDYQGENAAGDQMPGVNVFVRREGHIYHSYSTELLLVPPEPGQDGRPVDIIWPLWNLLDFTPEGRGETWRPRLSY